VEFTGGIFHPGLGRFHLKVTSCDVVDCITYRLDSPATIAREIPR
jgi:hypothetical protein